MGEVFNVRCMEELSILELAKKVLVTVDDLSSASQRRSSSILSEPDQIRALRASL